MRRCAILLAVLAAMATVGCAKKRTVARYPVPPAPASRSGGEATKTAKGTLPPATKPAPREPGLAPTIDELYGYASWYGEPYHGRRTASGETYNMNDMTAAHKTLPLGAKVDVKNLDNGKEVQVRINDRGPFVEGRVIDLSYAAAKAIEMIGPGVALVRLTPTEETLAARYGVQVGAFHDRDNAERLQAKLSKEHSPVEIRQDGSLYRVLVGAENSEAAANSLLQQLRSQKLFGVVVMLP